MRICHVLVAGAIIVLTAWPEPFGSRAGLSYRRAAGTS